MPGEDKQKWELSRKQNTQPDLFENVFRSINELFQYPPVQDFLQTFDDLFQFPFSTTAFHIDTKEKEDEYELTAEMPGVNREQIQIGIFRNQVVISVENREELTEEDEKAGNFSRRITKRLDSRSVSFPKPILDNKAKATFKDGLLKIRLPIDKGKLLDIE